MPVSLIMFESVSSFRTAIVGPPVEGIGEPLRKGCLYTSASTT